MLHHAVLFKKHLPKLVGNSKNVPYLIISKASAIVMWWKGQVEVMHTAGNISRNCIMSVLYSFYNGRRMA
jgi:hypothetical protein